MRILVEMSTRHANGSKKWPTSSTISRGYLGGVKGALPRICDRLLTLNNSILVVSQSCQIKSNLHLQQGPCKAVEFPRTTGGATLLGRQLTSPKCRKTFPKQADHSQSTMQPKPGITHTVRNTHRTNELLTFRIELLLPIHLQKKSSTDRQCKIMRINYLVETKHSTHLFPPIKITTAGTSNTQLFVRLFRGVVATSLSRRRLEKQESTNSIKMFWIERLPCFRFQNNLPLTNRLASP